MLEHTSMAMCTLIITKAANPKQPYACNKHLDNLIVQLVPSDVLNTGTLSSSMSKWCGDCVTTIMKITQTIY